MALQKIVSRRGMPTEVYSDQETNFNKFGHFEMNALPMFIAFLCYKLRDRSALSIR